MSAHWSVVCALLCISALLTCHVPPMVGVSAHRDLDKCAFLHLLHQYYEHPPSLPPLLSSPPLPSPPLPSPLFPPLSPVVCSPGHVWQQCDGGGMATSEDGAETVAWIPPIQPHPLQVCVVCVGERGRGCVRSPWVESALHMHKVLR